MAENQTKQDNLTSEIIERNKKVLIKQGEMRRKFKKRDPIAYAKHMADEAKQSYPKRATEINTKIQRFIANHYKRRLPPNPKP